MPKISVIMSVYNQEEFLAESIESILKQTFTDFEFIIVNDASTDNSRKLILKYANIDNRLKLIDNHTNRGLTQSLNIALNHATGKYIARFDADDISLPQRFELQYTYLEQNPDIVLCGAKAVYFNSADGTETLTHYPIEFKHIELWLRKGRNAFAHPAIMFRSSENLRYREKFIYSQDFDLYLNLLSQHKKMANLPQVLLRYRVQNKSVSFEKRVQQFLFKQKAYEMFNQRVESGKDSYNLFDLKQITHVDWNNSNQKTVLNLQVKSSFKLNEMKKVRTLASRYFQNYGRFNVILFYYFASFLNIRVLNLIRRTVFR